MTLLTANRILREESKMTPIQTALATVLKHHIGRMDGLLEEQSETAAEAARQAVAVRALRRRVELLEDERRKTGKEKEGKANG
jgi:hypothetical protein